MAAWYASAKSIPPQMLERNQVTCRYNFRGRRNRRVLHVVPLQERLCRFHVLLEPIPGHDVVGRSVGIGLLVALVHRNLRGPQTGESVLARQGIRTGRVYI